MGDKVAQRHALFQAPLLPRRWNPFKLRPQVEDQRDVQTLVQASEQRSHFRSGQVLGAQNPDPIRIGRSDRCNLVTEPLRQMLTFLPGRFKEPERNTKIGRRLGNLQFFAKKGNTIFLQPGEIVKKRSLNAAASALCESCMNYDPSRHAEYLTTNHRDSTSACHGWTRRLAQAPLQFFRIFQQLDYAFEQTARAAAVDAPMIETKGDLRFGLGNKFFLCFIP